MKVFFAGRGGGGAGAGGRRPPPPPPPGKAKFALDILRALGLADRVVLYDPCRLHRAKVYLFVQDGRVLPSPAEIELIRGVFKALQSTDDTAGGRGETARVGGGGSGASLDEANTHSDRADGEGTGLDEADARVVRAGDGERSGLDEADARVGRAAATPPPRPYAVMIDRSDATARRYLFGVWPRVEIPPRVSRRIVNAEEVESTIRGALSSFGVELRVMRAADMTLLEQWSLVSGAEVRLCVMGGGGT